MKKYFFIIIMSIILWIVGISCETPRETTIEEKKEEKIEKTLPKEEEKKTELAETAVEIKEINETTKLEDNTGILVVRFILDENKENKLVKLPNFRIRGQKPIEIDNSPSKIQRDAIHILKVPAGKYYISSLYSRNDKGEYEFDKSFPVNQFVVQKGKINYIGDIKVRMEEEQKSANIYARKLKLTLPSNNEETIKILQEKLKTLLTQYELISSIIIFN